MCLGAPLNVHLPPAGVLAALCPLGWQKAPPLAFSVGLGVFLSLWLGFPPEQHRTAPRHSHRTPCCVHKPTAEQPQLWTRVWHEETRTESV